MEVPERLAMIGGSILLASTLIFTLKSQASNILPKIAHPISSIYDHAGDAQRSSDFNNNFKEAHENGETTGQWGSAKYYIDHDMNLHIGHGTLSNPLVNVLGANEVNSLKSITFDQNVQAPQDSHALLSGLYDNKSNSSISEINNTQNLDISHVTNMNSMFSNYYNLEHLNLNNWNTSNVKSMQNMFMNDSGLQQLDISNFNSMNHPIMNNMFSSTALNNINIGKFTNLDGGEGISAGKWGNGKNIDFIPNINHPGTWVKQ